MNIYALNVVAINDRNRLFGEGGNTIELRGEGAISLARFGAGSPNRVQITNTGNGTRRVMGAGSSNIVLSGTANGTRRPLGTGQSQIVLDGTGEGKAVPAEGGTATIAIRGSGIGRVPTILRGQGASAIKIEGEGRPRTTAPVYAKALNQIRLNTPGQGWLIAHNTGGTSQIEVRSSAQGRSTEKIYGQGKSLIELINIRSDSDQQRQVYGNGLSQVLLKNSALETHVVVLPSSYHEAPKGRILKVNKENRYLLVQREGRNNKVMELA